ncbi:MAG: fibronectin type III domain-containing protein [Treponema sp.]|nr:fibronectin type III domain-containing protein [Treponema sp.]
MKRRLLQFTIIISALLFTACYSWFENKVDMDVKTPKINLGDLMYQEAEITELSAPTQVIVSQGKYSGTIKIHWDEVPYATSYRLERAVVKEPNADTGIYEIPDEGDFEILSSYIYSNNYSDLILKSPDYLDEEYSYRYFYRLSAENIKKGLESSEFTQITDETSGWLLPPPASIDAAKGENSEYIEVTWKSVPQANKYLIYCGQNEQGHGMEYISEVPGNRLYFKDYLSQNEKGLEFYYKVCAVLSEGSQSAFTGLALGYSAKEGAPAAPGNIKIENGKGVSTDSLTIKWDKVEKDGYEIKYNVYRTSSVDSIYKLVGSNIKTLSKTDNSLLKTGIKYYYYVQTIATNENDTTDILKSPFSKTGPYITSNGNEISNPDTVVGWLLSPPSNCEIVDSDNPSMYLLRWTHAVGSEVTDYLYNIYASNTLNGDYQLVQQYLRPGSAELTLGIDGYFSYEVPKGLFSFYRVTTVNDETKDECDIKTSIEVAPCPAAPKSVVASKTSSLNGLQNYTPNTNGVYPVQITWSAPDGESPYGYYVYRSTKPDSSFRKITDQEITGTLSYIDQNETARAGTMYYYKVVSLNILKQGKNANEQNSDTRGYGAITRDQWFREYNKTVKKSQTKLTLMHKGSTDALGSESANGDISGTLSYNAKLDGLGARITMHYDNYAEYYVSGDANLGIYFLLTGDTNTSANMSANGSMDGTNRAALSGMYPGYAKYDKLEIKGGGAGGGYYIVCTQDKNGNTVLGEGNVDWTVGEEK